MTARADRRRQVTRRAMVATLVAFAVVVAAGVVGATALYRSTDGDESGLPDRPVRRLPVTPNLLVGVVDERDELASVAVFTQLPGRAGGSVVSIPTNAAMTAGGRQVALASQFDGTRESLRTAVGAVLGLSFDDVQILGEGEVAEVVVPVDELTVDLPSDVIDDVGVSGRIPFEAGAHTMSPADAAAVLAARATSPVTGADGPIADENDVAVWSAVASAMGDGLDGVALPESLRPRAATVIRSVYSGRMRARNLARHRIKGSDGLVEVVRSDVLLVFGQISPVKVAAPGVSVKVRLVVKYPAAAINQGNVADVAAAAIDRLLFAQANVVSVSTGDGEAPPTTRIDVVTPGTEQVAEQIGPGLFGASTIVSTDYELTGVDLVVTLGESFLQELDGIDQTDD